jgi:Novel toxin 17
VVVGGSVPPVRDGWMWDLTVPGNNDHDFYVAVAATAVLVHNDSCPSISSRMRAAGPGDEYGLPGQGRIRYVPPEDYNPVNPLPRGPQGGYIDRFGNEWVVGPSRTLGQPFEWDVQLSRTGQQQLGWLSRDGAHVNVSPLGEVTH